MDTAGGINTIGYEALIRGKGLLRLRGASEVFARAEEFGGITALDYTIRDLELKVGLQILNDHQRMFLNMPQQALRDPAWLVLRSAASKLVIEVSEHARLSLADMKWLGDFRQYGVQVAIDDYGVGQTNLAMLSELRPEYLKLDLSFVRRGEFETVRKIRRFAEDWGTKLVVEGVESEKEAIAVMDCGVRYIQGFIYGRPKEAMYWHQRLPVGTGQKEPP